MHEHYCPAGNHTYDCEVDSCTTETDRNCDEHYELVASEGEDENTLYLLTITDSDNEYDGVNYAYITVTGQGLLNLRLLCSRFEEFQQLTELYSGTFPMCPGVSCTMLETVPEELLGGWEEDTGLPLFLEEPLPQEIVDQALDFRLTAADILLTGGAAFYLKEGYKHDRGYVESARLSLSQLSEEMGKL